MPINRRGFIATTSSIAAWSLAAQTLPAAEANGPPGVQSPEKKRRRIIVNRDAGLPTQWDKGREDYVNRNFAHLGGEGCQVDTVFWNFDEGTTAGHESKVRELQRNWESGETSAGLVKAIADGNDPPKVVVEECRKRGLEVFYSFRINGHEDSYLPAEVPQFKKDHPEYTLKGHVPTDVWSCLNFAIPAVRKQRLAVVEEVLEKYDFDGIEIDWHRGPYYFRAHQEYHHRYLLTDMMRALRRMVDERSKQVGRRLWLAVRVPETIEACLLDGLDVEVWAQEGLMDILSLGSGATFCDLPKFRQFTHTRGIAIFPCIYGYGQYYKSYTPQIARGIASNYWHDEPDGMYTFNYFDEKPIEQFREIGSPTTLSGLDKLFIAYVGWPGDPLVYYPHNLMFTSLPAELWQTFEKTPLTLPLLIGDDLATAEKESKVAELRLRVVLADVTEQDEVIVTLNGHQLRDGTFAPGAPADSKIEFNGGSLNFAVTASQTRLGRNDVSLRLNKRTSDANKPATIHTVDLSVRYRP